MAERTIPMVDLSGPDDGAASAIADAYRNVGFCYLVGHDIADDLVAGVLDASQRFHALPRDEKLAITLDEHHRGFIAMNTSVVRTSTVAVNRRPNQSESLMIMHEPHPDDIDARFPLDGANQWPANHPDISGPVQAYDAALRGLGHRLVGLVARSLGLAPTSFDGWFDRPITFLRLLWYPPHPDDAPDDLFGAAPHTDYGFVTILAQHGVPGLQVRWPDGTWVDAPPVDGAFVMNSGDALHRLTNGLYLSTPHRVVNTSGGPRFSTAYFFDPHHRTEIAPLPGCVTEVGEARFDPVNYGEYLTERLQKNYTARRAPLARS